MDVVPFVVEGGGVGVGENLHFFGDVSLSLSVGDCEGDASRSSDSVLSSVLMLMSMLENGERRSPLRDSTFSTRWTTVSDGEGKHKSEARGDPSDGLLHSLFVSVKRNFDITGTMSMP